MYLIVTEKQECMMFDFWERGKKKGSSWCSKGGWSLRFSWKSADHRETKPSSCIYSCFQSGIRRECSDLIITLHYVYRYSTIPLMEHLFMSTLFGINTVIYVFHSIYSLLFTWSLCLVNKKNMLSYYNFVKVFFCQWEAAQLLLLKSIQRETCLICRVITNRCIMEEKS